VLSTRQAQKSLSPVLDAGCGEGYYCASFDACLSGQKHEQPVVAGGFGISKNRRSGSEQNSQKTMRWLRRQQRQYTRLTGLWAHFEFSVRGFGVSEFRRVLRLAAAVNRCPTRGPAIHLRECEEVIFTRYSSPRSTKPLPGRQGAAPAGKLPGIHRKPNSFKSSPKGTRQPAVYWRCWRQPSHVFDCFAAAQNRRC